LAVARTSIWLYDQRRELIRCLDLYDSRTGEHSDGQEILIREHPAYFLALEERRLVVAHDAMTDPQTADFGKSYLSVFGITSMLDSAVRLRGQLVGVICLEHVGPMRRWTTEEEVFACAFADLVCLALEANERRSAESALAASETRFREIVFNATDAIVVLEVGQGQKFRCELANPAALAVSGFREEELLGKTPQEVLPSPNAARLQRLLQDCVATQRPVSGERDVPFAKGTRRMHFTLVPIRHERGHVYRIALIARDVTEQRRLEEELIQARKLEALGTLAGGIAHDMNNVLANVLGQLELLEWDLADSVKSSATVATRLSSIRQACAVGRDLVQQILLYSRRQPPQRQRLVLEDLLAECIRLQATASPPGVQLRFVPPTDVVPSIFADPAQLHQLCINLITNAIQAVEGREQGEVVVSLRPASMDIGPGVILEVRDNGVGISQDVRERMFEPFFTTKPPGRGTGLGLALVQSIVHAHGGKINVSSVPNQGTTFTVFLPVGMPEESHTVAISPTQPETRSPRGGLVLFVDDEDALRNIGKAFLRRLGFIPLVAADVEEAQRLALEQLQPLTAVVADQLLARGSGIELIDKLRESYSHLPAVLLTGLAVEAREKYASRKDVVILEKPFRLEDLERALCQARELAPA
jgi:PAS domain S-box-containing protein